MNSGAGGAGRREVDSAAASITAAACLGGLPALSTPPYDVGDDAGSDSFVTSPHYLPREVGALRSIIAAIGMEVAFQTVEEVQVVIPVNCLHQRYGRHHLFH